MTLRQQTADDLYASLERKFSPIAVPSLGPLVVPSGNDVVPRHRWFRMKEAYSHALLEKFLEREKVSTEQSLTVFDPFMGSGTTGASLADMVESGRLPSARFMGIETNPFLHLLASTKLMAYTRTFRGLGEQLRSAADSIRTDTSVPIPALSTFSRPEYFDKTQLEFLLRLRDAIEYHVDDALQAPARLAIASAVEPVSRLRRDGRALRYYPGKPVFEPRDLVLDVCASMERDARSVEGFEYQARHADSRATTSSDYASDGQADVILFSPPYPNNIDYTEVYKMEAWLLGYYEDADAFRSQRHASLRSHSSLTWTDRPYAFDDALRQRLVPLTASLTESLPADRYLRGRRAMIEGYVFDMSQVILRSARVLKKGGIMGIIVGNSVHGSQDAQFTLASDLILAELCSYFGLSTRSIAVARIPNRRASSSPYMRESLVTVEKA